MQIRRSFHKPIYKSFIAKSDAQRWSRQTKKKVKQTRMLDRDTVRSHVKNIGHTKFLSKDELKYLKPEDRARRLS